MLFAILIAAESCWPASVKESEAELTAEAITSHWHSRETADAIGDMLTTRYPSQYPHPPLPKYGLEAIQIIAPNRALIRFSGQQGYQLAVIKGVREADSFQLAFLHFFDPVPYIRAPLSTRPMADDDWQLIQAYQGNPQAGVLYFSQAEWEQVRATYGDSMFAVKNYATEVVRDGAYVWVGSDTGAFQQVPENIFVRPERSEGSP
jgi:hypothetical protein